MKNWQVAAIAGAVLLVGLGSVLAINNPDQSSYEAFATQSLLDYAGQRLCPKVPFLGVSQCKSLLVSKQPEIKQLISQGTQQQNYIFFTVYTTDLSPSSVLPSAVAALLPSYRFETIGIWQRFFIYQKKEYRG